METPPNELAYQNKKEQTRFNLAISWRQEICPGALAVTQFIEISPPEESSHVQTFPKEINENKIKESEANRSCYLPLFALPSSLGFL